MVGDLTGFVAASYYRGCRSVILCNSGVRVARCRTGRSKEIE